MHRRSFALRLAALATGGAAAFPVKMMATVPTSERADDVRRRVRPALEKACAAAGFRFGAPVLFRAFKEEATLEVWMEKKRGGPFARFRTWPVATWGPGTLGPKLREGDGQAPEGFYTVEPRQFNPNSRFHLSFNLGYPNAYDRAHGRTGTALMIHGSDVSVGCYAMTDAAVEEIYLLAEAALNGGQASFQVQCLPFRMTAERLAKARRDANEPFWQNLREGSDIFEKTQRPVAVRVKDGRYLFE